MGGFEAYALVPEQGVVPRMEQLDPAMQRQIRDLAARIDLSDGAAVSGFGARAQKEMGTFSDLALHQMLRGDVKPLASTMQALSEQIRACSFSSQAKGFLSRMMGRSASLEQVRGAYERAQPRISALCNEMTDRLVALMRDSAVLERIYERNETLYREICSLIVVGEEAVRAAQERMGDAQQIARMQERVQSLRVTQVSSTQLAAQIRMVQQSGETTCRKLREALDVTIPLWNSQMAAALGLARAAESLTMGERAQREAARGVRQSAAQLRRQAQDAAFKDDKQRAEETAEALLEELREIEQELEGRTLSGAETTDSKPGMA